MDRKFTQLTVRLRTLDYKTETGHRMLDDMADKVATIFQNIQELVKNKRDEESVVTIKKKHKLPWAEVFDCYESLFDPELRMELLAFVRDTIMPTVAANQFTNTFASAVLDWEGSKTMNFKSNKEVWDPAAHYIGGLIVRDLPSSLAEFHQECCQEYARMEQAEGKKVTMLDLKREQKRLAKWFSNRRRPWKEILLAYLKEKMTSGCVVSEVLWTTAYYNLDILYNVAPPTEEEMNDAETVANWLDVYYEPVMVAKDKAKIVAQFRGQGRDDSRVMRQKQAIMTVTDSFQSQRGIHLDPDSEVVQSATCIRIRKRKAQAGATVGEEETAKAAQAAADASSAETATAAAAAASGSGSSPPPAKRSSPAKSPMSPSGKGGPKKGGPTKGAKKST